MVLRRFLSLFFVLTLCWTTVACGSSSNQSQQNSPTQLALNQTSLSNGRYQVQQATYNDADGVYSLMLLNTPPGTSPVFNTTNLQMARLTDEEIAKGEKTYLNIDGNQAAMHLTEDFKIEYVHNVTETQTNPQTGQSETVVVRQESSFWTPFAGALAGQALGSLLFRPQYYVPPIYQPGGITGYGGYGSSYNQAVDRYQTKYNSPPPVVKNRQTLRTTGRLRNTSPTQSTTTRKSSPNSNKSTGSGFGSSRLGSSGKSTSTQVKPRSSFGSSSRSRSSGFSRGRRR